MKQFGNGMIVLAGAAALGALYVWAAPPPMFMTQKEGVHKGGIQRNGAYTPTIPRGSGFDFYVLALSWSPTYCQDEGARKRDAVQCSGPRPFAFVVHGLWPQFEQGYPRACQSPQTRPSKALAQGMLDIMPSERLVQHQWDNHGTCSGLSAPDYFSVVRFAAQAVKIPSLYASAPDWRRVNAGDVEAAFIAENAGMRGTGIGVQRRGQNVSEVRVCLTLDLKPRACPEIDQDGVALQTRLSLPPSRG